MTLRSRVSLLGHLGQTVEAIPIRKIREKCFAQELCLKSQVKESELPGGKEWGKEVLGLCPTWPRGPRPAPKPDPVAGAAGLGGV